MKHKTGKMIMGATLSLAAIGAAIDHTRHSLPQVDTSAQDAPGFLQQRKGGLGGAAPCSLGGGGAPCSLGGEAPCSLGGGKRFNDL